VIPLICLLTACQSSADLVEIERRTAVMGTSLEVRLAAADRMEGLRASEAALRAIEAVERRLSTWAEHSELARLNACAPDIPQPLSPALAADLAAAAHWWRATGGAFDPAVGSLVAAWNLRGGGRVPAPRALRAARDAAGFDGLLLEADTATILRPGLSIEEGGFGKGVGLDAALSVLGETGARDVLLDLGGQLALRAWRAPTTIALADPRERSRVCLELTLRSGSVATSGNSERGRATSSGAVGHVLDPRTGRPAPDFGSLSVVAPDATAADCLSTGLFVLGPDAALAFARAHEGIDVIVLEPTAAGLRARASAGLRERLRPTDTALTLEFVTAQTPPPLSPRPDSSRRP
jgi:thiamine biosynthesis lipoprotein